MSPNIVQIKRLQQASDNVLYNTFQLILLICQIALNRIKAVCNLNTKGGVVCLIGESKLLQFKHILLKFSQGCGLGIQRSLSNGRLIL